MSPGMEGNPQVGEGEYLGMEGTLHVEGGVPGMKGNIQVEGSLQVGSRSLHVWREAPGVEEGDVPDRDIQSQ